jgi:hypothetical protein
MAGNKPNCQSYGGKQSQVLDLIVALWESRAADDIPPTAGQMAELDHRIDEMEKIPRGEVSWDNAK